jgi:hypothetical protein
MDTPSNDFAAHRSGTPARLALTALALNSEDVGALDTLVACDVLVPVPDDAVEDTATDPSAVALPVLEQPGGEHMVPVFTSETELAGLLPFVSRYRLVPLGALVAQWPDPGLALAIDAGSPHGLRLDPEGIRGRVGLAGPPAS